MQSLKAALYLFVTQVTKSVSIYSALTGMFLYHVVFDKDFECSCKIQAIFCPSYMILPALIILFMVLWLDGSFQVLLKYSCLKGTGRFGCFLLPCIFRAVFIGLMWPISVLIDGDWFICCWRDAILDCTNLNKLTEDQLNIKELKITSRVIGFGVLLIITIVAGCLWPMPWRKCCCWCGSNESTNRKSECLSKDVPFKLLVLEEGEKLVRNKLREAATKKINETLNKYVKDGEWGKCCDVVDEIIENPQKPNPSPDENQPEGSSKDDKTERHKKRVEKENGSGDETDPLSQSLSDEL